MVEISSVSVKHFISFPHLATRYKTENSHSHARISTQTESDMHLQSFADTHGTLRVSNCGQAGTQVQAHVAKTNNAYLIKLTVQGNLQQNYSKLHNFYTV